MELNRRNFLGAAAVVAAAGMSVSAQAQDAGKGTVVGKRRFVAACPNATGTIARTPGPIRVMMIGAHPDDTDITCGGLTVKLLAKGYKVRFASITDGRMGHHRLTPDETAKTRRAETIEAARRFGLDGYDIYGYADCSLVPSYEARCLVAKKIREFDPDFIITHRTCDYHADHRATGQLVMDAGYLLGVPHWVPEAKAQRRRPVILYMTDPFTYPRALRPDVMVDVEPYLARWCDGLDAQVSQFYDWLPWDKGTEAEVAALGDRSNIAARNAYLMKYWAAKKMRDAQRFADDWKEVYPSRPVPKYMEAYEVSEYGRAPTEEDLKIIAGENA
ncbi:MAG: PIG-L family deacetylase [Kiritimatiellae bacterium]|nr:PIG-L family deacetylase [Kiritimatiellia bacterium]